MNALDVARKAARIRKKLGKSIRLTCENTITGQVHEVECSENSAAAIARALRSAGRNRPTDETTEKEV